MNPISVKTVIPLPTGNGIIGNNTPSHTGTSPSSTTPPSNIGLFTDWITASVNANNQNQADQIDNAKRTAAQTNPQAPLEPPGNSSHVSDTKNNGKEPPADRKFTWWDPTSWDFKNTDFSWEKNSSNYVGLLGIIVLLVIIFARG